MVPIIDTTNLAPFVNLNHMLQKYSRQIVDLNIAINTYARV